MQSKNSFTSQKQNNYLQPKHQLLIIGTLSHTEVHSREVVGRTKVWPPLKKRGSDMKERNRAIRRHHSERLKTKRSRFSAAGNCFLGDITTVSKGMTYHTPCRCSCWMCGNQRKFHGMNAQEKRARALFTD